ncbi:Mrpl13 [Kluyveromyces lactis]|nr:Mrpl13 [Kluyveromyces lactis]
MMLASRYVPVVRSSRQLTSSAVRADFLSWFRRNKNKDAGVVPVQPELQRDTKEVINEIESGKTTAVKSSTVTRLELTDDDFVGIDSSRRDELIRLQKLDVIPFNEWLSQDKLSTEHQLEQVVLESYQETFGDVPTEEQLGKPFENLVNKFKFSKLLQCKSGHMIPDYELTRLQTPLEFKSWFEIKVLSGQLGKFKESEPNAIDLSNIKFPPNVYVVPDVKPSVKKQKVKKILEEVAALEAQYERDAIEKAKRD